MAKAKGASHGREVELLRIIASGGPDAKAAREELVEVATPLVRYFADYYVTDHDREDFNDAVQEGYLAVLEVAHRASRIPRGQVGKLSLSLAVNSALYRSRARKGYACISLPLHHYQAWTRIREDIEKHSGQLAEECGLTVNEVELLKAEYAASHSLEGPVGGSDSLSDGEEVYLSDVLPAPEPLDKELAILTAHLEERMAALSDREKRNLECRYWTLEEKAARKKVLVLLGMPPFPEPAAEDWTVLVSLWAKRYGSRLVVAEELMEAACQTSIGKTIVLHAKDVSRRNAVLSKKLSARSGKVYAGHRICKGEDLRSTMKGRRRTYYLEPVSAATPKEEERRSVVTC